MEHVALYVKDLEGAREFFEKYFAAKSGERYHNHNTGFSSYFLTFDSGARLEIMQKPGVEVIENSSLHTGFIHAAFSVGSREKVDALTERLKADGYEIRSGPRTTGDGYYESLIVGFENLLIEITV